MSLPITDRNEATGVGVMAAPRRGRRRRAGVLALAVGIGLLGTPGTASAAPSDDELGAVTAAADDVAAQVSRLLEQMGAAQAAAEDATARAASAQVEVDAMQRAAAAARVAADTAAAEAQRAETDLAGARDAVARFARSSYMSGSSSPLLESLLTSSGPAQIVQRAALLDAAGSYRSTAVSAASTARERAVETQADAQSALTEADRLQDAALAELASAEGARTAATRVVADLQDRQNAAESELRQARATLGGPAGATGRSAPSVPVVVLAAGTLRWRRSGRRVRRPLPRLTTGTRSPSASPVATGASTPATATTAACSSRHRHGRRTAAAQYAPRADLATGSSRSPSRRRCSPPRARAPGRPAAGISDPFPVPASPMATPGCDLRPRTRFGDDTAARRRGVAREQIGAGDRRQPGYRAGDRPLLRRAG